MNHIKKLFAFVLALTMVFSMLIVAHAEGERIISYSCPNCTEGELVERETVSAESQGRICSHGYSGATDTYRRTKTVTYYKCTKCSYKSGAIETTYSDWEFDFCSAGYLW